MPGKCHLCCHLLCHHWDSANPNDNTQTDVSHYDWQQAILWHHSDVPSLHEWHFWNQNRFCQRRRGREQLYGWLYKLYKFTRCSLVPFVQWPLQEVLDWTPREETSPSLEPLDSTVLLIRCVFLSLKTETHFHSSQNRFTSRWTVAPFHAPMSWFRVEELLYNVQFLLRRETMDQWSSISAPQRPESPVSSPSTVRLSSLQKSLQNCRIFWSSPNSSDHLCRSGSQLYRTQDRWNQLWKSAVACKLRQSDWKHHYNLQRVVHRSQSNQLLRHLQLFSGILQPGSQHRWTDRLLLLCIPWGFLFCRHLFSSTILEVCNPACEHNGKCVGLNTCDCARTGYFDPTCHTPCKPYIAISFSCFLSVSTLPSFSFVYQMLHWNCHSGLPTFVCPWSLRSTDWWRRTSLWLCWHKFYRPGLWPEHFPDTPGCILSSRSSARNRCWTCHRSCSWSFCSDCHPGHRSHRSDCKETQEEVWLYSLSLHLETYLWCIRGGRNFIPLEKKDFTKIIWGDQLNASAEKTSAKLKDLEEVRNSLWIFLYVACSSWQKMTWKLHLQWATWLRSLMQIKLPKRWSSYSKIVAKSFTFWNPSSPKKWEVQVCKLANSEYLWLSSTTDSAGTLFRSNSMVSKMFKFYSRLIGLPYLYTTIGPELNELIEEELGLEVDPEKMEEGTDLDEMRWTLMAQSQKILKTILASDGDCPAQFRQLFAHIKKCVGERFPENVNTTIGGFIFLRFFCPAVSSPEAYGIVEGTICASSFLLSLFQSHRVQMQGDCWSWSPKCFKTFQTMLNLDPKNLTWPRWTISFNPTEINWVCFTKNLW